LQLLPFKALERELASGLHCFIRTEPGLWMPLAHAYMSVKEKRKLVAHTWLEAEECVRREKERLGKC